MEDDAEDFQPVGEDAQAVEVDEEEEAPKAKKRRGRPRKSNVARPAETEAPTDGDPNADAKDKQVPTGADGDDLHDQSTKAAGSAAGEHDSKQALSERGGNSNLEPSTTKPAHTATDAVDGMAKENLLAETKAKKEDTKAGTTPSQLGKSTYRVGLSRKSRIAPLLKSFVRK